MGEEGSVCAEKTHDEGGPRRRNSSVVSSCSEEGGGDSSSGVLRPCSPCPPEGELEYGPGIVHKLRTRFLTISLKQNRGSNIRRSCSMEDLLEQAMPSEMRPDYRPPAVCAPAAEDRFGHLKRAKSMDTLLMEMQTKAPPADDDHRHGAEEKGRLSELQPPRRYPVPLQRSAGGMCRISDAELPKPDTVRTYKRMFEPAESRRASHCRRPPVIKACARACVNPTAKEYWSLPGAKSNGLWISREFSSANPSPASDDPASKTTPLANGSVKKPAGHPTRQLYNGCHVVSKPNPVVVSHKGVNYMENNLNSINRLMDKKEGRSLPNGDIVSNGSSSPEILKIKPRDEVVVFSKSPPQNGTASRHHPTKPKIPPNRPSLKSPRPLDRKSEAPNENLSPPKLKPVPTNCVRKTIEDQNGKVLHRNGLNSKCSNGVNSSVGDGKLNSMVVKSPAAKSEDKIVESPEVVKDREPKPLSNSVNGMREKILSPPLSVPLKKAMPIPQNVRKLQSDTTVKISDNCLKQQDSPNSIKTPDRTIQASKMSPSSKTKPNSSMAVPTKPSDRGVSLNGLDASLHESPKTIKQDVPPQVKNKRDATPTNKQPATAQSQGSGVGSSPKSTKQDAPVPVKSKTDTKPTKLQPSPGQSPNPSLDCQDASPKSPKQDEPPPVEDKCDATQADKQPSSAQPRSTSLDTSLQADNTKADPAQAKKQSSPGQSKSLSLNGLGSSPRASNAKIDPTPAPVKKVSSPGLGLEGPSVSPKQDVPPQVEAKQNGRPAKKQSSPGQSTSMVFDFRGKDVVPHVAVLPAPFGCKSQHPKKAKDAVLCPNGTSSADDEDEEYVDYSVPEPCGVVFEGENVKIGRGAILATRNKELKITFDDDVDNNTFVYPSETSLLEDPSDSSVSTNPLPEPIAPTTTTTNNNNSSKLKANTTIGSSSAGGLFSYTPSVLRTVDNFEPGMFRPPPAAEDDKQHRNNSAREEEENREAVPDSGEEQGMLKPADPDLISSWSISAGTSDLLF